ncbi:MAG: outer membrane beta-barrel protein, partial [Bacteroidales bacterium]|nr:outer membrane beta-barrel protein [Bacteroidales bacterium]
NYSTESSTFNVPVYLGRNIINSRAFKLRAFTGPQFAWIMNATATGSRNGDEIEDFDSDFEFDNFTWLWSVGVGFELFMFNIDARYGFDLKGIEGANSLEQSFHQKTNMFEFTLGFKLF